MAKVVQILLKKIFILLILIYSAQSDGGLGTLEIIASPSLPSIEWPIPKRLTIMLMKSKMLGDTKGSMKYTNPADLVGISWVCPLHIFVAIFYGFTFLNTYHVLCVRRS